MLLAQSLEQDCETELAQTQQATFTVMGFYYTEWCKILSFS